MKHVCMREYLFSTILVCLLTVTFGMLGSLVYGAPNQAYSAEWSAPEETLSFLTDVVRLDMTKYNVTLVSHRVEYPSELGGLAEEHGYYTLECNESKLSVTYKFRNNILSYCSLRVVEGSPLYAQPQSTNVLDAAKSFLDRYQTYSGASYLQTMRDMLDTVTEIKIMTTTSGNIKLRVSSQGDYIKIGWMYTSNGIDFTRKGTYVHFEHGHLTYFGDGWYLYKIGSDSLNVSKEEAIRIARDFAKNVPWKLNKDNDTWVEVKDALVDEPVEAELLIGTREPLTLYPYWRIQLYFDWLYLGNVYGITVAMWADTGEILYYEPAFFIGGPPPEDSTDSTTPPTEPLTVPPPTEPPPEETPTEPPPDGSTDQTNLDPTPLLIAVPIVLAIILGLAFYRRKRNESLEPPT